MRMTPKEELLGADWVEHNVRSVTFAHKIENALLCMNVGSEAVDNMVEKVILEVLAVMFPKSKVEETDQRFE